MNKSYWFSIPIMCVMLAGLFVLASFNDARLGAASKPLPPAQEDPLTAGVDCSRLTKANFDMLEMQTNTRAGAILVKCGRAQGGGPAPKSAPDVLSRLSPLAYGGADRYLITGFESYPNVTQGDGNVAANGSTVIATYTDTRGRSQNPQQFCGVSYSTDAGDTWTRVSPSPFTGLGACYGNLNPYFSERTNKWYVNAMVSGCGSQGIGQWESADGISWTASGCVQSGNLLERPMGWVDNNPASPYYGRQYIAFNNFTFGGVAQVTNSTDDGVTWTPVITLTNTFRRVVAVDGSPGSDGTVFVQTLDEGGGGLYAQQRNYIHRSTDGGATWQEFAQNATTYYGPGRGTCSNYFTTMYTTPSNGLWRYQGWGNLGIGADGTVHYAYTARPVATPQPGGYDPGDIKYIRSTDNGATWSAPLQLNTDATVRGQWQPTLSVDEDGTLFVGWYDERNTSGDFYERYGRFSPDNGLTWQDDMAVSDVVIPKPLQVDPGATACYTSDIERSDADGGVHYQTWTDGRNRISGQRQADVYFDRLPGLAPPPEPTPDPCLLNSNYSSLVLSPASGPTYLTNTVGTHCDDCLTSIALPFPVRIYENMYSGVTLSSNGYALFEGNTNSFNNVCLPAANFGTTIYAYWDDLMTLTGQPGCPFGGCGIFTWVFGEAPNRQFAIEWRAVYYNNPSQRAQFTLVLYETPDNPTQSASQFDVFYLSVAQGSTSATAGVQRDSVRRSQIACNSTGGIGASTLARYWLACDPAPTSTPTITPTNTPTSTPTNIVVNTPTDTPTNSPTSTSTSTPTPTSAPDFSISVTPSSNTVVRPGSVQYDVTITSLNGFGGNVSLSVSGLPSRTTGSFNPPVVTLSPGGTGSSILTITADRGGPRGTFALTLTGTAGAISRSQVVTLVILR